MDRQKLETKEISSPDHLKLEKKIVLQVPCEKVSFLPEARVARGELQDAITALIRNFEDRTGCAVEQVLQRDSGQRYWKVVTGL